MQGGYRDKDKQECLHHGIVPLKAHDRNWSMGDRQLFPPTIVSPALKRTGGYPLLPDGKATFRNRPEFAFGNLGQH